MKITFFRLKGYIKVLNGMGLEEIAIPFDTFKNRIILVQGENGCSKSTIISALSPTPDSSDSFRTDVFIDAFGNRQIIEYPAEKEIHYIDIDETGNTNYYQILIQSIVDDSRTRRTTKAFISKNGEELNPNGNVASFKEIRDSILGIDPIYLDLSSISSENRGIVDMIPSERRKYMASYIGSLDTYNNIFKTISRKVNSLKSYMNTLSSKIYELGDENELRLKLMQLETSLSDMNKQRDKLLGELAEAEATVRIVDPENKMQDLYVSISDRIKSINFEMQKIQDNLDKIYRSLGISSDFDKILKMKEEIEENIHSHTDKVTANKAKISTNISLNEATFNSIESDRNILIGLNSNTIQSNIEEAVSKLREDVSRYEEYLIDEDIKILKSTSIDELNDLRETLTAFLSEISSAEELYNKGLFDLAVVRSIEGKSINQEIDDLRQRLLDTSFKIGELKQEKESIENNLSIIKDFDNTRPKECKIDSCPYISKYVQLRNNGNYEDQLVSCINQLDILEKEKSNIETTLNDITKIDELVRRIDIAITLLYSKKSIISKIKPISKILDNKYLIDKLISLYRFPEFNIVSQLIEKAYIYLDLDKAKNQLLGLENDLKIYTNNKALIESLTKSINKNESVYSKREEEIKILSQECTFLENIIAELSNKLNLINSLISLKDDENRLLSEKDNLRSEFESVKDKIKLVKEKMDSVNDIKNRLSNIEESISPLSETINQIKFNLSNIIEYQAEYKDSSDKYDKMVFVRNACSPGNGLGIQSEYIKRYMNDIIIDCNKMLGYMFNGSIQLDVPIINEKQFSIPFLGPNGIIVPDISNGSTAQKCMIGLVFSCVAMMKSSIKYNIPRFDEIDGGLDQQNRIMFINVLNQILDFMHCDQCIICSHNNEFDTQSTTRLMCSHTGIKIEQ